MERWINDNLGAILTAIVASWFAFTKWLATKLLQRYEARMQAIEARQEHYKADCDKVREHLETRITRVEDKIDAHYRIIDSKIESILHHLMSRSKNQREGDQ